MTETTINGTVEDSKGAPLSGYAEFTATAVVADGTVLVPNVNVTVQVSAGVVEPTAIRSTEDWWRYTVTVYAQNGPKTVQVHTLRNVAITGASVALSQLLPALPAIPQSNADVLAARVAPLETAVATLPSTYVPGVIVAGAGIDPTGASDSTAAIQAKINQAVTSGARVIFPPGIYAHTGLTLDAAVGVELVGLGGLHATGSATKGAVLKFTGTGTGAAISARGTTGLAVQNLAITHTSTAFTGRLLDLRNNGGVSTSYFSVERCQIGGSSGVETALCVDVDGAIEGIFDRTKFYYYNVAISGQDSAAAGYSVGMQFHNCHFGRGNTTSARNGGDAWLFDGCVFNNHTDGSGGHYASHTGTGVPNAVSFLGCWFGDITSGTRAQIEVNGRGFVIEGNVIGIGGGTGVAFTVNNTRAVSIRGNRIQGGGTGKGIDFGATTGHSPMMLGPNSLGGVSAEIAGTPPTGSVYFDASGLNLRGMTVRQPSSGPYTEWKTTAGLTAVVVDASGRLALHDPATGTLRWTLTAGSMLANGVTSRVGTETANQFEVHTDNTRRAYWTSGGSLVQAGGTILQGQLDHDGTTVGFYGATPVAKAANPGTATGTDAAVINAIVTALRNLGLVT